VLVTVSSVSRFFFCSKIMAHFDCIDCRGLNKLTRKDSYPLPRVDDTLDELKDAIFYTHLELAFGSW
jgi:hypothetical protein